MKFVPFFAILFFCSCAVAPTAYAPIGPKGGYYDFQVAENVFVVRFSANGCTPREQVRDFCLLRSAEVAKEHGFRYFEVLGTKESENVRQMQIPEENHTHSNSSTSSSGGTWNTSTDSYTHSVGSGSLTIVEPKQEQVIRCFKEKPDCPCLDSEIIIGSLRGLYNIPDPTLGAVIKK